jgi:hypothetical protein
VPCFGRFVSGFANGDGQWGAPSARGSLRFDMRLISDVNARLQFGDAAVGFLY